LAKRLSERELENETRIPAEEVGKEICRVCAGGIIVDPANNRPPGLPHRLICRRCGAEYGTTRPVPRAA
jgi:ribosomal protein L40E